jgi:hypothetical protein
MKAIALKWKDISPGRSMPGNGKGRDKTLQAINDAVITRPFCVRMHLALQLFIMAIGAMNGEGSIHHRNKW